MDTSNFRLKTDYCNARGFKVVQLVPKIHSFYINFMFYFLINYFSTKKYSKKSKGRLEIRLVSAEREKYL